METHQNCSVLCANLLTLLDEERFGGRLSNHPDFVRIIPILLENPESRPICRRDRKNPDFNICFMEQEAQEDTFVQF